MVIKARRGFTIVELLIVIVVIGILAAIIIVAYVNVTKRATSASLQSDLTAAAKQLETDKVTNAEKYPASIAAANSGRGIQVSNGNILQYTVNNTSQPASYCASITNGLITYYITQTGILKEGLCPGHTGSSDSNMIVNLVTNPSVETGIDDMSVSTLSFGGTPGTAVLERISSTASTGSYAAQGRYTVASTGSSSRATIMSAVAPVAFQPSSESATYTVSAFVRSSKAFTANIYPISYKDAEGTQAVLNGAPSSDSVPANTWRRISYSALVGNVLDNTGVQSVRAAILFNSTTPFAVGDVVQVDGVMITKSNSVYPYADGTSTGWSWIGTPQLSASRGPAS